MRKYRGYVLALLGFLILVTSLVLSTPFAGHTEPRAAKRTAAPQRSAAVESGAPPSPLLMEDLGPLVQQGVLTTVQETGPILFKEGELEAYLTFPVPVGKRMIIESVSARAQMTPGLKAQVMFTATAGGGTAAFALPMTYQGRYDKQGDTYASALRLRAYADGGSVVTFRIDRSAVGDQDSGFVSISGVLETR
jgi:hypothetical protein